MTADTSKSLDLHAHPEVGASPAAPEKDEATIEQASIDRTCNGNLQVATGFLEEAARYFENRPTNGEDRAHWANVQNAENCRKVAAHVAALTTQLEVERATGDETARHISRLLDHLARETARADAAEKERDRLAAIISSARGEGL